MRSDDAAVIAAVCGLILVVGYLAFFAVLSARTEADCLSSGYPAHNVTWNGARYCIKRVDQTDIVVPFDRRDK